MVRGMTKPDEADLEMGADRVRAAMAGTHPGDNRWDWWASEKSIGRAVMKGKYLEPEGTASFLLAAMMCRKVSNPKLTGRFAYTEALYAKRVLEGATRQQTDTTSLLRAGDGTDMYPVCEEVLGVRPGREGSGFTLPMPTYMSLAVGLGRSWKLVNQTVHGGMVYVDRGKLLRLMRDAITAYIRQRVVVMPAPPVEVPVDISGWCEAQAATNAGGDVPPCIEQCRGVMDHGGNLSHAGRYFVGTYFINGGLDDEAIGDMFAGAPDYDRKITMSQIRQIRSRGYRVPSCSWVESNGLCPGCSAHHPTKYKKPESVKQP